MTSLRQIEANRRNASKSTGPNTEEGKERSRRNAIRHGLTAETVIGPLEDAEDYKRFEEAVTADFNPETAVERELVLRLASLLWRLRRASSIETGLFQDTDRAERTDADQPSESHATSAVPVSSLRPEPGLSPPSSGSLDDHARCPCGCDESDGIDGHPRGDADITLYLAQRFLRLAAEDKGAFERLNRYETTLWRQVCQTVFMLGMLRRQNLDAKWLPSRLRPGSISSLALSAFGRR